MRRRIPVVATAVVVAAIAAMIWLGLWQLRRLHWKEALIARYATAANQPPILFPDHYPVSDDVLFRHATAQCPRVVGWAVEAGRTRSGTPGWRHIARCTAGVGQIPVMADLGVSDRPSTPSWLGGAVSGTIAWAPSHESLLARIWGGEARRDPMIVAEQPAPGLEASEPPSVADIPNNHLSYAVQWFLFAATAAVIYALALRRRIIADPSRDR